MTRFMNRLQWVWGLQRTASSWHFRDCSLSETPDEYAEALADHIARQLVN